MLDQAAGMRSPSARLPEGRGSGDSDLTTISVHRPSGRKRNRQPGALSENPTAPKKVRMGTNRRLSLTQCTAWGVVIGGHVLLFLLFSSSRPRVVRIAESESVSVLLDLTPPPARLPTREPRPDHSSATPERERPSP